MGVQVVEAKGVAVEDFDVNSGRVGAQPDDIIQVTYGAWVTLVTAVAELKQTLSALTQVTPPFTMSDRWLDQTKADHERD